MISVKIKQKIYLKLNFGRLKYECVFVTRHYQWWNSMTKVIFKIFKDLEYYKKDDNVNILKRIEEFKKKREEPKPLDRFLLLLNDDD